MTQKKLVLYNAHICPYAARAVIALDETKTEHEVIPIDLNVPRPEWYLKDINPYGQVPALKVDDKDIILESLFVAEYVSDLHPEAGLFPSDPLQRAQIRYLIHHYGARVQTVHHKATFTTNTTEAAKHYEDLIVELEKFNKLLLNADRKGSEGPYFLGEKFTFADLAIAPFATRWFLLSEFNENNKEITAEKYPQLKRFLEWKEAIRTRPSVLKAAPSKELLVEKYRKWLA
ncbi:hypothetical protein BGZ76_007796 [Entomortierella beljakovae]|nr:hypothetical protein BGZ76_007796 [Entomortierella beljakovae]